MQPSKEMIVDHQLLHGAHTSSLKQGIKIDFFDKDMLLPLSHLLVNIASMRA